MLYFLAQSVVGHGASKRKNISHVNLLVYRMYIQFPSLGISFAIMSIFCWLWNLECVAAFYALFSWPLPVNGLKTESSSIRDLVSPQL